MSHSGQWSKIKHFMEYDKHVISSMEILLVLNIAEAHVKLLLELADTGNELQF